MQLDVIQTAVEFQPATRHELFAALTCNLLVAQQRHLPAAEVLSVPTIAVDDELVAIITADTLGEPVRDVAVLDGVGRFVRIEYEPLESYDPDIVLALVPGAQPFHRAVLEFQRGRYGYPYSGWDKWYRKMKDLARALVPPLLRLQPHPLEADFVVRWALSVCAHGRTI
jgi:hypothetical protein